MGQSQSNFNHSDIFEQLKKADSYFTKQTCEGARQAATQLESMFSYGRPRPHPSKSIKISLSVGQNTRKQKAEQTLIANESSATESSAAAPFHFSQKYDDSALPQHK